MSKRIVILAATSPLAFLSLPVLAQVDDRYAGIEAPVDAAIETYSEEVVQDIAATEADWAEDPRDTGAAYANDYAEDDWDHGDGAGAWQEVSTHHGHGAAHDAPAPVAPVLAYSAAERAEWLSQCRALRTVDSGPRVVYADDRDDHAPLIGGVLGAVAGGVIGNRVADRHRLAGTLVGAGLGGIAGAVVGSIIDSVSGDDEDDYVVLDQPREAGFDYCEAYLLNYERGYGVPAQVTYAPVMIMPAGHGAMAAHHTAHRMIVEEIEVEAEEPAEHHTARRTIHRREAHGDKRIPLD